MQQGRHATVLFLGPSHVPDQHFFYQRDEPTKRTPERNSAAAYSSQTRISKRRLCAILPRTFFLFLQLLRLRSSPPLQPAFIHSSVDRFSSSPTFLYIRPIRT